MIHSNTFTFTNVLIDSFIKSKAEGSDIAFEDVVHMNEIWTVKKFKYQIFKILNFFLDFTRTIFGQLF